MYQLPTGFINENCPEEIRLKQIAYIFQSPQSTAAHKTQNTEIIKTSWFGH